MDFLQQYDRKKAAIERFLFRTADGLDAPAPLKDAMLYALHSGGKRLRPMLLTEACGLFAAPDERAYTAAAAVECIHTYSLIHDDLPAMDNDDFRRGKPTVHKAFDEGIAILAGDALLNFAYEQLFALADDPIYARAGSILATACGAGGLIGGQALDIAGVRPDEARLQYIYKHKTGDLIASAVLAGGVIGGADETAQALLKTYGEAFGFAFQIADDFLDEGEDQYSLVNLYGREKARQLLNDYTATAVRAAESLNAPFMAELAARAADRKA